VAGWLGFGLGCDGSMPKQGEGSDGLGRAEQGSRLVRADSVFVSVSRQNSMGRRVGCPDVCLPDLCGRFCFCEEEGEKRKTGREKNMQWV
jgi:hypothetical protein